MALSFVSMGQAAIGTSVTTFYTNSSGGKADFRSGRIMNTTAGAITVSIWCDQDGTSATDTELLTPKDVSVPANSAIDIVGHEYIANGGTIKGQAASSGLIWRGSGWEGVT